MCVWCLDKITFLLSIFSVLLAVLGPFCLYAEFDDTYPKNPMSVSKKDISDHIYQSIYSSLWFYCSRFGSKSSWKMATLDQNENSIKNATFFAGAIKPWKWWPLACPTYLEAKKSKNHNSIYAYCKLCLLHTRRTMFQFWIIDWTDSIT